MNWCELVWECPQQHHLYPWPHVVLHLSRFCVADILVSLHKKFQSWDDMKRQLRIFCDMTAIRCAFLKGREIKTTPSPEWNTHREGGYDRSVSHYMTDIEHIVSHGDINCIIIKNLLHIKQLVGLWLRSLKKPTKKSQKANTIIVRL